MNNKTEEPRFEVVVDSSYRYKKYYIVDNKFNKFIEVYTTKRKAQAVANKLNKAIKWKIDYFTKINKYGLKIPLNHN